MIQNQSSSFNSAGKEKQLIVQLKFAKNERRKASRKDKNSRYIEPFRFAQPFFVNFKWTINRLLYLQS